MGTEVRKAVLPIYLADLSCPSKRLVSCHDDGTHLCRLRHGTRALIGVVRRPDRPPTPSTCRSERSRGYLPDRVRPLVRHDEVVNLRLPRVCGDELEQVLGRRRTPELVMRLDELLQTEIATGIGIGQRVVQHIRIAVEALQIVRMLDERVRAHEAPDQRVVQAPVHVDDAHLVEVLMHGVAAVGVHAIQRIQHVTLAVDVPSFAPGVVGQALTHGTGFIGDHRHRPQVVVVQVAHRGGGFAVEAALALDVEREGHAAD